MRLIDLSSIAAIAALAVVAASTTALAGDAPTAKPAATDATAKPAAAAPAKPARVCTSRTVTGSLMPVRECHTAEQWADIKRQGQDSFTLDAARHMPASRSN